MHQEEEDLSSPAELALEALPEEEGIEVALVTTERRLSCLKTQPHLAQKACQNTSSKDNRFVVERANFRYVVVTYSIVSEGN